MSAQDKKSADGFAVGYGKPPAEHRFKSGQSGNTKGRPRKSATFAGAFAAMLASTAPTTINGKRCRKTVVELAVMRAMKDILTGSPRALERWISLMERYTPMPADRSDVKEVDLSGLSEEQISAIASIKIL